MIESERERESEVRPERNKRTGMIDVNVKCCFILFTSTDCEHRIVNKIKTKINYILNRLYSTPICTSSCLINVTIEKLQLRQRT